MDDFGTEVEQANRFERGAAKEDEPLAVVFVVVAVFAVKFGPVVVLRLVDQIDWDLVAWQCTFQERARDVFATNGDFKTDPGLLNRTPRIERLPEGGHHEDGLVAEIGQFERETSADV